MMHSIVKIMHKHRDQFNDSFVDWLPDNLHVWDAFVDETHSVIDVGFMHYSARTIVHVLRHHSAIRENEGEWKINDHHSPYLARLWALVYPHHANLFEYRKANVDTKTIPLQLKRNENA